MTAIGYDGEIDVSWTVPADNGSPITGYRVDVSPGGNFCSVPQDDVRLHRPDQRPDLHHHGLCHQRQRERASDDTTATPRIGNSYVPLTPTRVLDPTVLSGLHAFTFQVTGLNVPTNATAVTGVLSVSGGSVAGYLSLTPAPIDVPTTSNLNFPAGDSRSSGVTVTLGAGGTLSVTYGPTLGASAQVAFDVSGYFIEGTSGSTYFSLAPKRVFDSRIGLGQPSGTAAKLASGVHQTLTVSSI